MSPWANIVESGPSPGRLDPFICSGRGELGHPRPVVITQYSCYLMRDGQISALVIEDEADIRQLLRTVLERVDYSVSEASEGLEACGSITRPFRTL